MDEEHGVFGLIAAMRQTVTALRLCAVSEDELVDVVGEVKALVASLTEYRKGLEAEMPHKAVGRSYRATESRSATRSYNTNGLLAAVAEALSGDQLKRGPDDAVRWLIGEDAVRLTWRWTPLKRVAEALDLTLTIASHEIEDGDPNALVGEVWSTTTGVEAVEVTG